MTNTTTAAGETKKFLDTHQAAAFMGFAPFTLRKWRAKGSAGPRFFKVHGRVRYAREDLESFLTKSPRE